MAQRLYGVEFTQSDRDRLIRLEAKLEMFMKQTDKRFEDMNSRFEDMNRRFEDMNSRFEDMNKRFDEMITFLWIITGIFVVIMSVNIGFAYWDRRTSIKKAKEETIEELEKEGKLKQLIEAMRKLADKNPEIAEVLRQYHLL